MTPPDRSAETITVLICDDHELVADGLAAVLGREPDITVVAVARTMAQGIEAAEHHAPDVTLMDYELPDGRGDVATAELKRINPTGAVIMLTSHNTDEVLAAALEAGSCGFLTKDTKVDVLIESVRKAAAGEALITRDLLARLLPRVRPRSPSPRRDLTPRELEVLTLLAEAADNETMAKTLYISVNTVRNHVANLTAKLGVHSRLEAVALANREGLLDR
ncbi:MAG TPA: response regulator transcription factor [Egibacteraceae bacterium]|nr:response regulator transcription factor [Egibacteraceae bacterium]